MPKPASDDQLLIVDLMVQMHHLRTAIRESDRLLNEPWLLEVADAKL